MKCDKPLDSLSLTSKGSEKLSVGRPPFLMPFAQVFLLNLAMRPANVKSDQFLRLILVPLSLLIPGDPWYHSSIEPRFLPMSTTSV